MRKVPAHLDQVPEFEPCQICGVGTRLRLVVEGEHRTVGVFCPQHATSPAAKDWARGQEGRGSGKRRADKRMPEERIQQK